MVKVVAQWWANLWVMPSVWRWILDTQPSSHMDGLWRMSPPCCVWVLFNRRTCENKRDYGRRWRRMDPRCHRRGPGMALEDFMWWMSEQDSIWKDCYVSRIRFGRQTNSRSADLTTASAERSQVHHSEREDLMCSSSQDLNFKGTAEPVALFSHQSSMNQDPFSKREQLVDVLGSNQSIFRFSFW